MSLFSYIGAGLWWLIFSRYSLQGLPADTARQPVTRRIIGQSYTRIIHAFRRVRGKRTIAIFLIAFFFYDMGVTTVMGMSSVFASKTLNLDPHFMRIFAVRAKPSNVINYSTDRMDNSLNSLIWLQFGAALDMLENAIRKCPEDLWTRSNYCYISFHTIFFTDYYLCDTPLEDDYQPPAPFSKYEFIDGAPPDRIYTQAEQIGFLNAARQKLKDQLNNNSPGDLLEKRFTSEYKDFSLFEMLLYNMRHVQHHVGQLNMLLRQGADQPSLWSSRTYRSLQG